MFPLSNRKRKFAYFVLAIGLVATIGISDYYTDEKISFYVFYALPIFIAAWNIGNWAGIFFCIVSSAAWFIVDLKNISHPDVVTYFDAVIRLVFFIIISLVLSELHYSIEKEKNLARTDFLTGLPNRRTFLEQTRTEIERAKRYFHPCTLAYLDLDHFKPVNDKYGHEVGDCLLKIIGRELRKKTRANDSVARIGGDEFVILLPETDSKGALPVLEHLHRELSEISELQKHEITFSMGAVTYLSVPESAEEMIRKADRVMYEAKRVGKNTLRHQEVAGNVNLS